MTVIPSSGLQANIRRTHRTAAIVGWGLMSSLAFYLLFEEILRSRLAPFTGFARIDDRAGLRYLFYAGAIASVLLVRFLNAALLRRKAGAEADPKKDIGRLGRAALVTLALAELPALLGLVLFFLGGFNRDFYVLVFVSLALFFIYFPRLKNWEAYVQSGPAAAPACRF